MTYYLGRFTSLKIFSEILQIIQIIKHREPLDLDICNNILSICFIFESDISVYRINLTTCQLHLHELNKKVTETQFYTH